MAKRKEWWHSELCHYCGELIGTESFVSIDESEDAGEEAPYLTVTEVRVAHRSCYELNEEEE
jgi:hypothetical protein